MKKNTILLLITILISNYDCKAQLKTADISKIDSLKGVIQNANHDTTIVKSLISWEYIIYKYDMELSFVLNRKIDSLSSENLKKSLSKDEKESYLKAKSYALYSMGVNYLDLEELTKALDLFKRSLKIREELEDEESIAKTLTKIGFIYYSQGDFVTALNYFKNNLHLRIKIGDKDDIASAYNNLGLIHFNMGDFANAIKCHTQSLKIAEEQSNKMSIGSSLNNIGSIYFEQGDYVKAVDFYKRSLAVREEIGDKQGAANVLGNLGLIYKNKEKYEKAIAYFTRSLDLQKEVGSKQGEANALGNTGSVYELKGDHVKALKYYLKSLKINEQIESSEGISVTLNKIGDLYYEQGLYKKSLDFNTRALFIAQEKGIIKVTKAAAFSNYLINKKLGRNKDALLMHELYISSRDSLESEANQKEVIRQEFKYSYEKKAATDSIANAKEKEVKDLQIAKQQTEIKAKRTQQAGLASGLGLMFILAFVFFMQRNRISKEKARSEELLLNILPEETAKELKEKGSADAQLIDHVTVLFTDFKGFTAMSENLSPKELVEDLHQCFSAFDHIMEKYGIEKIKTIGDAYMAAGGLPTPNKTHAHDVVKAALEMAEVVHKGKNQKIAAGLAFFEVRIGVHTGPVVAGIVGVKKFQYDIWGDTVNTASRMESSGEVGKVNISQSTYELLKNDAHSSLSSSDDFEFESRGKIKAKGKGEIEMWFVKNKEGL